MPLIIMIPAIMAVAVGSVVGIRALYNRTAGKGQNSNRIDEYTKTVGERTRNLANGGK